MRRDRSRLDSQSSGSNARSRVPLSEASDFSRSGRFERRSSSDSARSSSIRDTGSRTSVRDSRDGRFSRPTTSTTNITNINRTTNITNVSVTNITRPTGHWSRSSSFHHPVTFRGYGYKPKSSTFFHTGFTKKSSRTSFFFSFHFSSSSVFYRHRSVFYPTFVHVSYWPWRPHYYHWNPWPYTTYVYYQPRVIYRPLTTTVYVPQTQVVHHPVCTHSERQAWEFLAMGPNHLHSAVDAFHCLAEEHPYEALTLIGYSIATARAGDYERAAMVMRHAVRTDAEALRHVPADARIDEVIIDLIGGYSQLVHVPGREIDSLFMIAALRTILPDAAAAHFAVSQAIQQGDQDASAYELRDLLSRMLHEELFPGP